MVVKWTFYDPIADVTHTLDVNPSAGGSPDYQKSISYMNTSAPDGKTIIFEGRDKPNEMTFEGTILSEEQYNQYKTLFDIRHQVLLTDDLGREFWIYFTGYTPRRGRKVHYPWYHTYTVKYVELDWQ